MPKKRKMSKIRDIYSAVKKKSDLREDIHRYFRYDSELFNAIELHIARAPDCGLIDRRGKVRSTSASYGVSFKKWNAIAKNEFTLLNRDGYLNLWKNRLPVETNQLLKGPNPDVALLFKESI